VNLILSTFDALYRVLALYGPLLP